MGFVLGDVERLEGRCDLLPVGPTHKAQSRANEMYDAGLEDGLGESSLECLIEPREPVSADKEDVLDAATSKLVQDGEPEFGPLGLCGPNAEYVPSTVEPNAERNVEGSLLDLDAVSHRHASR